MNLKSLEKKRIKLIKQMQKIRAAYDSTSNALRNKLDNVKDEIEFLEEQRKIKAINVKPGDWFMSGPFYIKILSKAQDRVVALSIIVQEQNVSAAIQNHYIYQAESWKKCKAPDTSVFVKAIDDLMNRSATKYEIKS